LYGADIRRAGLVGEDVNAKILFLAVTSSVFERPLSVAVKGPSSAGKSFLLTTTRQFLPPVCYISRTSLSPKSLVYGTEPLSHRHLFIEEADGIGDDTSYFVRTLISEGRLVYEFVETNANGQRETRTITRDGSDRLDPLNHKSVTASGE
jgi:hypothetical protein